MRKESIQVELQIAPLVDVCFLLLFFFMATARPKFELNHIDVAVASMSDAGESFPPVEEQTIQILDNGQVLWNEALMGLPDSRDLAALSTSLQRLKSVADRSKSTVSIVINPADKVAYQRMIDVMIACQRSGVTNITLATEVSGGN